MFASLPAAFPAAPVDAAEGPPTLHLHGLLAVLRLNRPSQRNRLDDGDLSAIVTALQDLTRAVQDDAGRGAAPRVLVLASSGPAFSAGYHLDSLAASPADGPQRFEAMVRSILRQPLPTVCRLQGGVYGGATDLALACDFRIGSPAVQLRMPAARIGLHYSPDGLARFAARLGLAATRRLFLTAPTLPAEELMRIGYLDECVADDAQATLDAAVMRWCEALVCGAPLAVQGMRRTLDTLGQAEASAALEREARCAASADLQEGLAALRERRPPRFTGR